MPLTTLMALIRIRSLLSTAAGLAGGPRGRDDMKPEGIVDMKFILGLLAGLVLGAMGAVLYSVRSGRDLRDSFEQVRADLQARDIEALGSRLESQIHELQAQLDERIGQARERATATADDAAGAVDSAVDQVADAAKRGSSRASEAAMRGTERLGDATTSLIDEAVAASSAPVGATDAGR